jgi:hypothetical protein
MIKKVGLQKKIEHLDINQRPIIFVILFYKANKVYIDWY